MKIKLGITRIVFIIGNYAFKIPNFKYSHHHFLQGCYANWSERKYYKNFINADYESNLVKHVAPSYFCLWFGLFQIQARCEPLLFELSENEKEFYSPLCGTDNKKENFGMYKNKIVCLDYA